MADCSFEGCDRKARSHGLCGGHLYQRSTGKELRPLRRRSTTKHCEVEGCEEVVLAKGLCSTHYGRSKRKAAASVVVEKDQTQAIMLDLILSDRIEKAEATAYLKVRGMILAELLKRQERTDEQPVVYDDAKHNDALNGEEE